MARKGELLTESGLELNSSKALIKKKEGDSSCLLVVKGVPCTVLNEKTSNGRIYPIEEVKKSIDFLKKTGAFESRRLICSASDHPENSLVPKPISASHVVIDAYIKEEDGKAILYNDWLILPTFNGQQLAKLLEAKVTLGTSIRGTGVLDENGRVRNYMFYGTDVVGIPSAGTYFTLQESIGSNLRRREGKEMEKNVSESIVKMTQQIANLQRKLKEKSEQIQKLRKLVRLKESRNVVSKEDRINHDRLIAMYSILESLRNPNFVSYRSPVKNNNQT